MILTSRSPLASLAPYVLAAVPAAGIASQSNASDATLAALRRSEAPALSTLRAGAPVLHTLSAADRHELRSADQASGELADLRAGALTNNEMLIIGLTVLAVILLILIL